MGANPRTSFGPLTSFDLRLRTSGSPLQLFGTMLSGSPLQLFGTMLSGDSLQLFGPAYSTQITPVVFSVPMGLSAVVAKLSDQNTAFDKTSDTLRAHNDDSGKICPRRLKYKGLDVYTVSTGAALYHRGGD